MERDEINRLMGELHGLDACMIKTDEGQRQWAMNLANRDYETARLAIKNLRELYTSKFAIRQGDFNEQYSSEARKQRAAEQRRLTSHGCEECGGQIWRFQNPRSVIPCSKCMPEQHSRWANRGYVMNAPSVEQEIIAITRAPSYTQRNIPSQDNVKAWGEILQGDDATKRPEDLTQTIDEGEVEHV